VLPKGNLIFKPVCPEGVPRSGEIPWSVEKGGDGAGLLDLLSRSSAKAEQRYGVQIKAIVIQEAGLDGFWIHRLLLANGIESHVVDAASIAVARWHRRAKTCDRRRGAYREQLSRRDSENVVDNT
jgi:transposase